MNCCVSFMQKDLPVPDRVELGALYAGLHDDGRWYRVNINSIFQQTQVATLVY